MRSHRSPPLQRRSERGSAFITVLLFTFLILTLVATLLKWSLSERSLNSRASYWLEARNAAEAVAEYGFSQVSTQFSRYASPPSFSPTGSAPLSLPPSSYFSGGNVTTTSLELIGGPVTNVPSSGLYFIDPSDPNNSFDPLKGQYVYRRDIQVLAKATVTPPGGGTPVTAYVTEKVEVRGAPLFANAIFYGRYDLEVFPGPTFNIYGPVHTNGNLFVSSQGSSLNFYGPVSASGSIYHAWANVNTAANGAGNETLGSSPVNFSNASGTLVALKDSNNVWQDSTRGADASLFNSYGHYLSTATSAITQLQGKLDSSFRQYASQTWGGNVQTAAMGVQSYNPISFDEAIDSSGTTPDPHSLIDPPATQTYLNSDPTYTDAKTEVEKQKYSNQSALYVKVTITPGTSGSLDKATINVYGWPGSDSSSTPASTSIITATGNRALLGVIQDDTGASTPNEPSILNFIPFEATASGTTTTPVTGTTYTASGSGTKWRVKTTTKTNMSATQAASIVYNGSGDSTVTNTGSVTYSGGSSSSSTGSTQYSSQSAANSAITAMGYTPGTTYYDTTGSSTTSATGSTYVNSGLYDRRQNAGINLVQLDVSALRSALNDMVSGTKSTSSIVDNGSSGSPLWGPGSSGGYSINSTSSTGWNGAVYVEVGTTDGTTSQTSIAIANGQTASSSTSLLPTVNADSSGNNLGLTVATNAPMYVLGNFNSDGSHKTSTTGATTPDDGYTNAVGGTRSSEIPVALAADAISVLSPNYFGVLDSTVGSSASASNGSTTSAYKSYSTASPSASDSVEIAAAFITGLVTTSDTATSGGVHNLPRFLESWSGKYVTIRGSLVSLYLSQVASAPWSTAYYSPPNRNWGFDQIFQNGTFPPLTPKVLSYRRTQFSDLNATTYAAAKHAMWPSLY